MHEISLINHPHHETPHHYHVCAFECGYVCTCALECPLQRAVSATVMFSMSTMQDRMSIMDGKITSVCTRACHFACVCTHDGEGPVMKTVKWDEIINFAEFLVPR